MASSPDIYDDPSAASAGTSFKAWLDNPASNMTWVIAGRSHSGKTTLVENLLSQPEKESSDANRIEVRSHKVGNSELKIIEIPGLDSIPDQSEATITNSLQSTTGGEADMLLYCVSIDPSSRLDNIVEGKTIKLLTTVFKAHVWERAILVFTFADYAKDRHAKNPAKTPTLENVKKEYAQKFEEILKAADIGSFTVLPLYHTRDSEPRLLPQEIPALPAGETLSAELLPSVKWEEHLYSEMLKKCTLRAVPMLVNIGKNQLLKGNMRLTRVSWFGVVCAAGIAYYFIARYCFGLTSVTGILSIGGLGMVAAIFAGIGSSTWASSARSIAQVRFQQDQAEKKQH